MGTSSRKWPVRGLSTYRIVGLRAGDWRRLFLSFAFCFVALPLSEIATTAVPAPAPAGRRGGEEEGACSAPFFML